MNGLSWKFCLAAIMVFSSLFAQRTPVLAAEEGPGPGADRPMRLERRINELAERQEQMMNQVRELAERQEQMMRRFQGGQERQGPNPSPGQERMRSQGPQAGQAPDGMPPRPVRAIHDAIGLILFCWIVINLLLAVWIFTDIRKRGEGSGIFIALAVLAGIPAAIIYSLVRLGDRRT